MVGWHHQLNRHEFKETWGDSAGQGSMTYCSSRGREELDTTVRLNNNTQSKTALGETLLVKRSNQPSQCLL